MSENYTLERAIRYLARSINDFSEKIESKFIASSSEVHQQTPQHHCANEHGEHGELHKEEKVRKAEYVVWKKRFDAHMKGTELMYKTFWPEYYNEEGWK